MNKIFVSTLFALVLVGGAFVLSHDKNSPQDVAQVDNVRIENGVQIIEITARGGYFPRKTQAQAGIPTVIRFNTQGTFDCSSAVRIPSMNISKVLPQTGITDIDVGSSEPQTLVGSCGMGMYPFEVEFKS